MAPALPLLGQPGSLLNLEDTETLGPSSARMAFDSILLTNTSQWYFDTSTSLASQRFYRAWPIAGSSNMPTVGLNLVLAITLTGPVGNSVRVEYLNRFGPIDAWVALDTMTLGNPSQLYFDVSAP
jgi:hypothetical protein